MTGAAQQTRACPALFIAGIASGQGKTTVTAALARYHSARGLRVRVFKSGPDFLDPMILQAACARAGSIPSPEIPALTLP